MLTSEDDSQKIKKGKKILWKFFYGLLIILLIIFVFFLITYLLKKGKEPEPSPLQSEFPPSPVSENFPPPPQFVKILRYYFSGPYSLEEKISIVPPFFYAVLCKKDNKYDIIYIGNSENVETNVGTNVETTTDLLVQEQYDCWIKNCGQEAKNLQIVLSQVSAEKYDTVEIRKTQQEIESKISPPCLPGESETNK